MCSSFMILPTTVHCWAPLSLWTWAFDDLPTINDLWGVRWGYYSGSHSCHCLSEHYCECEFEFVPNLALSHTILSPCTALPMGLFHILAEVCCQSRNSSALPDTSQRTCRSMWLWSTESYRLFILPTCEKTINRGLSLSMKQCIRIESYICVKWI